MTPNSNPLKMYFRTPALHLKLPSGGKFWPEGSLDMPPTGEIPVLPMTAVDEIAYRTPDALFNGSAIISVIQSCCPNIKNAWVAPSIDMSAILMAIRMASYGGELDVASVCPACNTTGDYGLDLQEAMGKISLPDFDKALDYGDLQIYFRPVSFQVQNELNIKQFEQQRIIYQVRESDMPEAEANKILTQALQEITSLTVDIMTANIAAIRTPSAFVNEAPFIKEFIQNCDRKIYTMIRDRAVEFREKSDLPPLNVKCSNCEHEYQQPVILDATNFFDSAS